MAAHEKVSINAQVISDFDARATYFRGQEGRPASRNYTHRLRTRKRDPLPFIRVGARVLYDVRALETWLRRQRRG